MKSVGGFDRGMMHTVGMAEASLRAQRQWVLPFFFSRLPRAS